MANGFGFHVKACNSYSSNDFDWKNFAACIFSGLFSFLFASYISKGNFTYRISALYK